jgi:hypothetical protein
VVLLVALGAAPWLVGSAAAGGDPYGSTTTEAPSSSVIATCALSAEAGQPGDSVSATVSGVPAGELVRILFGGIEVGRAEAAPGPELFTTVTIGFTVPDVRADTYLVVAVGDTFTAECEAAFLIVAGEAIQRPGSVDADGNGNSGGGGGSLPRTGIYVGLLLAVAVALLLMGRALLEGSRRRRRRASRLSREVWMAASAASAARADTDGARGK